MSAAAGYLANCALGIVVVYLLVLAFQCRRQGDRPYDWESEGL